MTTRVLEFAEVVVRAGGRTILDVPRFSIDPGETVALVGPNGAGKTTFLHVAALLRRPERGAVSILGDLATARNEAGLRRRLSVVFQDPLLFDLRVLANAAAGARFQGQSRAEAERRARAWLARFGVAGLVNRRARSLSGGEAARVALARAFATEPSLLLLDEPFSALDAPTRARLLPTLRERLQETGTAAILVTHDLEEAFAFATRIVLMDAGRIAATGDMAALIAHPPTARVAELLGIENILPARISRVDGDGVTLSLQPAGPTVRLRGDPELTHAQGQHVMLTLPAGAVRVLARDHGAICQDRENCLPGRVIGLTPLRSGTRVIVATPAPIEAILPWDTQLGTMAPGDLVTVTFSAKAGHLVVGA